MSKMGRPPNPNKRYIMVIHHVNKYQYASTKVPLKSKEGEDEKSGSTYKHWGTLDENLTFHPFVTFLYQAVEEQEKYIFPEDWDLSELSLRRKASQAPVDKSYLKTEHGILLVEQSRSYGAIWLMEQIGNRLGVRQDLLITFKNNASKVDDIMTVAMFLFLTNYNVDRLQEWQVLEKYPAKIPLSPSDITTLEESICEQHRIDFLKCRIVRIVDKSLLAVDSTTKSSFGVKLIDVAWGKNKEGLNAPVTLEVVVYSLTDHVPVYYRTFAGNSYDSRTIEIILADLKEVGLGDIILMMDRAYPSLKNLNRFILDKMKIVACTKAGAGFALKKIKGLKPYSFVPEGFVYSSYWDLYVCQFELEHSVKTEEGVVKADRLKLNLYFDPVNRSRTLKTLDIGKEKDRKDLDDIIASKKLYSEDEKIKLTEKYDLFELLWKTVKVPIEQSPDYTPKEEEKHKRGRKKKYYTMYSVSSYKRDEQALVNAKISAGFRALITLGVDFTADEAMDHYSLRAEQEMDNEQWKTLMPCDRERTSTEKTKTGSSFIQFVCRIMSCYLRYYWRQSVELRKLFRSSLSMIDEMRRIRCVEYPEQDKMMLTPFQGKQLDICKEFGFDVPKGCAPRD